MVQTHRSAFAYCGVAGALRSDVGDRDAAVVLLDPRHLGVVPNDVADFPGERFADHVHAAYRLKHRALERMRAKLCR